MILTAEQRKRLYNITSVVGVSDLIERSTKEDYPRLAIVLRHYATTRTGVKDMDTLLLEIFGTIEETSVDTNKPEWPVEEPVLVVEEEVIEAEVIEPIEEEVIEEEVKVVPTTSSKKKRK